MQTYSAIKASLYINVDFSIFVYDSIVSESVSGTSMGQLSGFPHMTP